MSKHRFAHLQLQAGRTNVVQHQRVCDHRYETAVGKLPRRHVDGDLESRANLVEQSNGLASAVETPLTNLPHQSLFFEQREEIGRMK